MAKAKILDYAPQIMCVSCGHASHRDWWIKVTKLKPGDIRICPHCGSLVAVRVRNLIEGGVDEDGPEEVSMPKKPKAKKPAAKKPAAKKPAAKQSKKGESESPENGEKDK